MNTAGLANGSISSDELPNAVCRSELDGEEIR